MIVTMLLADDGPPFRKLWEGELPAIPNAQEPLAFNGRQYMVLERSWRFGVADGSPALQPMNGDANVQVGVGLLLQQIGGPPHVTMVR